MLVRLCAQKAVSLLGVGPNPSIDRTAPSGLCPLPAAAHVERYTH